MHQTFIGIDLGTTFLKGAVIHLDTLQLDHVERIPCPPFIAGLPPNHREVDPILMAEAVRELVHRLLPYAPHAEGLVMCTQMHGLVLTTPTGQPLSNAITWQDQRTEEAHPSGHATYYQMMSESITPDDRRLLGNDLWASRPLSFLYWMREKGLLPSTQKVIPASLPDFTLAYLCGQEPRVELTNAAAYGALNVVGQTWHRDLIDRLGLGGLRWPSICPFGEVTGTLRIDGQEIPCYTPVGDHQCAVLGTLLHADELSINVSTGSQVGMITSTLETSLEYQTRPYFDNQFLKAVIHIPAGRALNALIKLLTELAEAQGVSVPDPWSYITRVTSQVDHTDLHVNMAFFPSSCGDTGAIDNLHEETLTVAHLFAGAFQNMGENYAACARRIWPEKAWQRIVFSGGLVQKVDPLRLAVLRQFNCDHRFPPTMEDTLMGLMVLALKLSGRAGSVFEAMHMVERAQPHHTDIDVR